MIMKQTIVDYVCRHQINELLTDLLRNVLETKPSDLILYCIDYLSKGPEAAAQDAHGLTSTRRQQVNQVFEKLTQGEELSFNRFLKLLEKDVLHEREWKEIYKRLDVDEDGIIGREDFYKIIGVISHTCNEQQFHTILTNLQS